MQGGRFASSQPRSSRGGMERPPGTAVEPDGPSAPTRKIPTQSGMQSLPLPLPRSRRQHVGRDPARQTRDGFWLRYQERAGAKLPPTGRANIRGSPGSMRMQVAQQGPKTPGDALKFRTRSPCIPKKASQLPLPCRTLQAKRKPATFQQQKLAQAALMNQTGAGE